MQTLNSGGVQMLADKLYDRLKDHIPGLEAYEGNLKIQRTYAGYVQRSAGAWSWYFVTSDEEISIDIGSQWSATECLNKPLSIYKHEIIGNIELVVENPEHAEIL